MSRKRLIGLGDIHGRHVGTTSVLDGDDVREVNHESMKRKQRKNVT